jgi:hypothetical protein
MTGSLSGCSVVLDQYSKRLSDFQEKITRMSLDTSLAEINRLKNEYDQFTVEILKDLEQIYEATSHVPDESFKTKTISIIKILKTSCETLNKIIHRVQALWES